MWTSLSFSLLLIVIAYLLGSFPTGYLLGRYLKGIDIREYGSGSTGATNVLRNVGKLPALVVFIFDSIKGALAVALVNAVFAFTPSVIHQSSWQPWLVILVALMSIIGHSKSIWLKFTGGKSVATSLGILIILNPMVGLGTLTIFLIVLGIFRIVSLSSITAAFVLPLLMFFFHQPLPYMLFSLVASTFVIWRHLSNIQRLLAGLEPRLGEKLPL